ncbi:hypothetical protein ACM01_20395 [Streptomyces viridochromogenes]|uniref:AMP-dependent synthetase/ligase domain-containing protein n=1 Tax=Streptomyces viridochromogenes TaxID=1938 RepID=A0A0J7ZBD9_STRVR|nr:AMP-binding protein [Streptomyces viridochromogenes]KMS73119.1 hypothetical protein ACM01_20395 [Streptomyces viridochromogenes]KOG11882.1 hypothetical protein ADK36_36180 [Streptomyces viridochromogenes]KOG24071.1 hypothetical protein ADK35_11860 [Streptomyces viridochromogenes]
MPQTELFEAQAARTPHAVAVVADGTEPTYDELNRHAGRLAHHLAELGAGAGTDVAAVLPRRPEVVVALLAVLKTGTVIGGEGLDGTALQAWRERHPRPW